MPEQYFDPDGPADSTLAMVAEALNNMADALHVANQLKAVELSGALPSETRVVKRLMDGELVKR